MEGKTELVTRSYSFAVRAEEGVEGHIITGRPIVYESRADLYWYDEIIERGALDGADLTDVRFLVNHDISRIPLARARRDAANSTMQLLTDYDGMGIRVSLDTENNAEARSLYSAVKRGDITGMSFMFKISDEEWEDLDTDHPTRRIKAISSVAEVSAVTFPAYRSTEINARDAAADDIRAAVEKARRSRQAVESGDLELLKEKAKILGGIL